MSIPPDATIRRLRTVDDAQVDALADLLVDSVDDGASVGFMYPLEKAKAVAFWRRVADGVAAGERALLIAEDESGIVGTVHLMLALPENQPHRADLTKMLVHPRARRRGLGTALMEAAEEMARDCGRTLLGARHGDRKRRGTPLRSTRLDPRRRDPGVRVPVARWAMGNDGLLQEVVNCRPARLR